MKESSHHSPETAGSRRYAWDTPEFARVANLSDAVFAIAMTLLVLTLDVPDVAGTQLGAALLQQLPQFIAFVLSFALVSILWWHHHRFFEMVGSLDSGLIVMNLVLLGAVVLVPFPTNLVGKAPDERVAVMFFISLFLIVSLLYLFMTLRAHAIKVWRGQVSASYFFWMVGKWSSGIAVELFALIFALWFPVAGLVVLAVSMIFGPLASHLSRGVIRRYTE
jgi:uncharacterized membrane protein